MDDFGLNKKGFKRKQYADLIGDMEMKARELFGENINLSERSFLGLLLRLFAWFLSIAWQLAEKVYNSGYVDTAEGIQLDNVAKYIGISRLTALPAVGTVQLQGSPGTIVEAGFLVSTKSGIQFKTTSDVEINPAGTVIVPIIAVIPGNQSNVPTGSIGEIVKPIAGVDEVINLDPTTGGRDRESDHEFRKRYDISVSRGGSSTVESIRATLLDDVDGVRDAIVEENTTMEEVNGVPPKSIAPFVFGGEEEEIIQAIYRTKAGGIRSYGEIEKSIEDSMGNTHIIGFTRPKVLDIYVQVELTTDNTFPTDGVEQVRMAILGYIGGYDNSSIRHIGLGLGEDVVYTRIISVVHQVPGIIDVAVKVGTDPENMNTSNIAIAIREVAETSWEKVDVI